MDMSKIQRALGVIEGVCVGLADAPAEIIESAITEIDCELEHRNNGVYAPLRLNGVQFEEGDCLTSTEMEELTERLKKHFTNYQNGRIQDYATVFRDCLLGALAITQLVGQLKDKDCESFMGRP